MANWYDDVPAPVDANGREVPLDTRKLMRGGKLFRVCEIAYNSITERWVVRPEGPGAARGLSSFFLPDSWEQLEEDASKGLCGYFGMDDAPDCKGCPAYGDRLSTSCNSVMARDLVRRAKALAGVAD